MDLGAKGGKDLVRDLRPVFKDTRCKILLAVLEEPRQILELKGVQDGQIQGPEWQRRARETTRGARGNPTELEQLG